MAGFPKPKKYNIKNPHKYIGDPTKIIMRSSWERKLAAKLDEADYVLKWGSEPFAIPYVSPVDGRTHRYFTDFIIITQDKEKNQLTTLVEVKPYSQTKEPVKKKGKRKQTYINECVTYMVNQAKWEAARKLCQKKGWVFKIFTEKELSV